MTMNQGPSGALRASRWEAAITLLGIPAAAASLLALGGWLWRAPIGGTLASADRYLALAASLLGVVLAAWWLGGALMLGCARFARLARWHRLERIAQALTPKLLLRAVTAAVGIQLVVVSAATAAPDISPFFADDAASASQAPEADDPEPSEQTPTPPAAPSTDASGPLAPAVPPTPGAPPASTVPPGSAIPPIPEPTASRAPIQQRITDGEITVVAGDTLWELSRELLGGETTDARVLSAVAAFNEHNDLCENGNLIRPGDRVRIPPHLLPGTSVPTTSQGASS